MKLELDENLSIHDFKRLVLTLTDNKPFYLKTNICNSLSLADLVSQLGYKFIMISTDSQEFEISAHRKEDENAGNLVLYLNDMTSFGDLNE